MSIWYAVYYKTAQPPYGAGDLYSTGDTVADQATLDANNFESKDLGELGDTGPDFETQQWDPITKTFIPKII